MLAIGQLKNPVQHYAWGSPSAIPELLGQANPDGEPWAELWMGTHPKGPSEVRWQDAWHPLAAVIAQRPAEILGARVAALFEGRLPFLFKVLAAAQPLSIQAHPNKAQALDGFAREDAQGIPLDAGHRNYRDPNHKPEMVCALVPFWALRGFRKIDCLLEMLGALGITALADEIEALRAQPNRAGLKSFFSALMHMAEDRRRAVVAEAVAGTARLEPDDPVRDWILRLNKAYPGDVGVLSPALLNLIQLQPGDAMFLPAGELHAYLDGVGIELMANSDNVLRGGLTPKHMDVPELLSVLTFADADVEILRPADADAAEKAYPVHASEFALSVLTPTRACPYLSPAKRSVEILICTNGDARIRAAQGPAPLPVRKGDSFLVPASVPQYTIEGDATFYKAAVPDDA